MKLYEAADGEFMVKVLANANCSKESGASKKHNRVRCKQKELKKSRVLAKSSKELQAKKVKPKIEEHCRVADVADDDDIV